MKDVDVMAEWPHQFVEVPLDRMLFDWLQAQLALRPTARRLSDLFDATNPDWMARFERFVHAASGTSRTITITRLIYGAPRAAVAGGIDAVYVEMLFCIAGLVPRAMAHYVTICPNRLEAAAESVFRLLGLSGTLAGRPAHAACLYRPPTDAAAQALVKESLGTAGRAVDVLAPSTPVRDLTLCLNAAALGVLGALVFLTGHRGHRIETIARSAFALEPGIWYVADKRDGSVRAVPLVPLLVASLRAYEALVGSLAYRLRKDDPRLAQRLLQRLDPWSTEPYFFRFADGDLKPLGSEDLRPIFAAHGLRLNDGRRWLSVVLRDAGLNCHVENAVAGRSFRGQYLYPSGTALAPFTVVQATRAALLARCSGWDVPAPRILAGRGTDPACPAPSTVLVPEREPLPRRRPDQERCALRLEDGYRLTRYFTAKAAFERSPPAEPWIAFVFELIFAGGVSHSAELHAALDAALERRVAVDGERVTIATRAAELGLRQVVLSSLHASLIARLPRELPLRPVVVDQLDAAAARLLGSTTEGALRALLDAARAAHALVIAPPVRDFAAGFIAPPVKAVRPASNWDDEHSS